MKAYTRVHADIDLDAVSHNLDVMNARLMGQAPICAVIKADAYGHGAIPIARHIESRDDIWGFAVATPEEGVLLREAGIRKNIILLGYAFPESYEDIIDNHLAACIFEETSARILSETAVRKNTAAKVHIALDTGMGRIGFPVSVESAESVKKITQMKGLEVEGMFSHFARCDEVSLEPARVQLSRYRTFLGMLEECGVTIPVRHTANSAGIMRFPEASLDLVRAGITLYGLTPSDEVADEMVELWPVMQLKSHLSYVKTLPAGCPISYGGTFVTEKSTRVATVPVGYADGYPRMLSGKGSVLIRGRRAPILGRVCMDQFMVDVSDIPDAAAGDEVVLLGSSGGETIQAEEIGALSGRFNYELVSLITKRVPRNYILDGQVVEQVDYFV